MSKPATSAITPLLACSRLALVVLGCGYFLLSVALCQRLFRPRAKAAYSSRSRRCRSSSTVCQGDTRYDKNRIRSDPPLAECTVLYHASLTPTYALTNNLPTICCVSCLTVETQHICCSTHHSPPNDLRIWRSSKRPASFFYASQSTNRTITTTITAIANR
jgi:hypothetical protein